VVAVDGSDTGREAISQHVYICSCTPFSSRSLFHIMLFRACVTGVGAVSRP
jgi:hypothetical protein